jgi:hypothetical protein
MPEINGQGTRLEERAPWESYDDELLDQSLSEELEAEIAEYSKHRWDPDGPVDSETADTLAEMVEANAEEAQQYAWATPDEYQDVKARIGKVMHSSEFIQTLRKAGVECFYRQHPHADKAVLWIITKGTEEKACWVQQGNMPELSILKFDRYGVPLDERMRGWRTALLQLILADYITEDKANRYFGFPKLTAAFGRYNSTLYEFRNRAIKA